MALVRTSRDRLLPRYFLYYFLSDEFQSLLKARTIHGSTVERLPLTDFPDYPVRVPPLTTQRAISDILQALDDRIDMLRQTSVTLEAVAQVLFKSWFIDFDPVHAKLAGREPESMDAATAALFPAEFEESALGLIPRGWRVRRLADVVERVTKGTTPTTLRRPFVPSGITFIKAESMTDDGNFLPEKFAFIDNETHELLRRSQLAAGDVLISIAGTIGRTAVMPADFLPANTNQAVAIIRPRASAFPSGLVARFLKREDSRQAMGERVVQAVQANLSLGTLSELRLVVPPGDIAVRLYETSMGPIDEAKTLNRQRVRTLSALRDALIPRLISGKLRLPEAQGQLDEALA